MSSVLERREYATPRNRAVGSRLLLIGGTSFAIVLLGWLVYAFAHATAYTIDPADLKVYNDGGLIVRHVSPPYNAQFQYPLYDWPLSKVALRFTYTPFAALFFLAISYIPWAALPRLSQVVNLLLLAAAAWFTMDALSYLPGGRPPVPPGVRATWPDRKIRDRIRPFRADSYLPGGRPPVPPGVRATWPDRKIRDRIRPFRADSYLPGGRPPVPPGVRATWPDRKIRDRIRPFRADSCLPGARPPVLPGVGATWPDRKIRWGRPPVPSDDLPDGIARLYRAGGLDWRVKLGGALLGSAAALLTEPVFRTMYLGQINLLLMALIIGDLRRPGGRPLKGAATGIAAGIKLIPLVFIPYLLLTRRFRAAAMATGTFAATVALGFIVIPGDSTDWWLHGVLLDDRRTGFVGWGGNQSLNGILVRLAGSINGATVAWLVAAIIVAVVGLTAAVLLDRAGHSMLAILATALVGLLDSPISWDHHWVWVVPGMMAAAYYASSAWQEGRRSAARWCAALAAVLFLIFAAWPGALWSVPITGAGDFTNGLVWAGPNSKVTQFMLFGDNPGFLEYHWRGLQNLSGNAFILTGVALLILLAVVALRTRRASAARHA